MKSIHQLTHGSDFQSQVVKQVSFTYFLLDVNSIGWSKRHLLSTSFAGLIIAAVLSSIAAFSAIVIAVWFIRGKIRAEERDDIVRNGESIKKIK